MHAFRSTAAVFWLLLLPGCGSDVPPQPPTLQELALQFLDAQAAGDGARLCELARSVCPTTSELEAVLRPGELCDQALENTRFRDLGTDRVAELLAMGQALFRPNRPEQTVVRTYAATTEELAEYRRGTVTAREFPYRMQQFAQELAAPERTWYVAEVVEPDDEAGAQYSCFTQVGGRFVYLPDPWLLLRE